MPEKYGDRFLHYDALFSFLKGEMAVSGPLINLSLSHLLSTKYVISSLSSIPLGKIKKPVLSALLCAVSELLFSEGTDDYAVCDSAVAYVKRKGLSGLSGFVNAIVRRAARERESLLKKIEGSEDPEIRFSLPKLILRSLENDYGNEKAELIEKAFFNRRFPHLFLPGLLEEPVKTIDSLSKKGFVLKKDDSRLPGYYLERSIEGKSIIASEEFEKGLFYMMDRSSMADAEAFLDIKEELPEKPAVLDLCAAPGGKSLCTAAIAHDSANIDAFDISEEKVSLIRENTARLHIKSVKARVNDASIENQGLKNRYDLVLCDVPCSGFGVIGRKPSIRYRHDENSLDSLLTLQRAIVKNAAAYIRQNGFLIYSTCTLRKAENEGMADFIKNSFPEMRELSRKTFFPDEGDFDGFFTAVFQKGALS